MQDQPAKDGAQVSAPANRGRGGRGGYRGFYQRNNNANRQFYYPQQVYPQYNGYHAMQQRDFHPRQQSAQYNYNAQPHEQRRRELSLGDEKDLESKQIKITNKIFFVDVKENKKGKFMKIAEQIGPNNRKSRIHMTLSVGSELSDKIGEFVKIAEDLPEHDPEKFEQKSEGNENKNYVKFPETRIKSETIVRENRRYYLDLKENQRGRFLRITMMSNMQRAMITVPISGLDELKTLMVEYVDKYASPDEIRHSYSANMQSLMESTSMRVNRTSMFYFDVGMNRKKDLYLRISDVRPLYRNVINIPQQSWEQFRDTLQTYLDKLALTKDELNSEADNTIESKSPIKKEVNDDDIVDLIQKVKLEE